MLWKMCFMNLKSSFRESLFFIMKSISFQSESFKKEINLHKCFEFYFYGV